MRRVLGNMAGGLGRQALRRALSVPIYVKVLGIGLLVTTLFGVLTFHEIRVGLLKTHYQVHGETALAVANLLSKRIEPLINAGDTKAIDREIHNTLISFPDVRYAIIQAPDGQIISHGFTFPKEAPPDLTAAPANLCGSCHASLEPKELPVDMLEVRPNMALSAGRLRAYTRESGLILEITLPIGTGEAGSLRLGVSDRTISRVIGTVTISLLRSLILCALVGLTLAFVLTYIVVRPIHELLEATNRIREGDFASRARIIAGDEIGRLAESFNQMAKGLQSYREEVCAKEAVRLSLIGRIVHAQEEERTAIARELHDSLGQSLSKTLLTIESSCKNCLSPSARCTLIKQEIRGIIDEVRQLAWDTRPSVLDDYGLDSALHRYVDEMSKRVDFQIDYQYANRSDAGRLPAEVDVTLYRIAQEAVTNVIRHAGATQVSVILTHSGREVSLIVEDNGRGFDVASVEKGTTPPLGLMGMRERAALVGGELAIYSHPGEGATIRVRIALNGASDAHTSFVS